MKQFFPAQEEDPIQMYIREPAAWGLGDLPSARPTAKPYRPPFTSGGEFIREGDADKLLTILSGPSPYQNYIQPLVASKAASALPKNFLRIVSSPKEVPEYLRGRFAADEDKIVGGTIDRRTGTIYMVPAPGRRTDTRLEFALHEAVHLFAHPFLDLVDEKTFQSNYGRSCSTGTDVGTFQRKYCRGFGEGATQVITEQIMEAQGISKYRESPYAEFTPPVLELIRIFSLDRFARAYFWGAVKEFTQAMEFRWGNAWQNVANFTAAGKTKLALAEINKLEIAYIRRRGPKGDFPPPSSIKRYA
jgi:hypothetical protein